MKWLRPAGFKSLLDEAKHDVDVLQMQWTPTAGICSSFRCISVPGCFASLQLHLKGIQSNSLQHWVLQIETEQEQHSLCVGCIDSML